MAVPLSRRRGMTMIEIMVVVTVLAVLMGLSFPAMRGVNEKNKLRAAALDLVGLMKLARVRAVMDQHDTNVFLDLDKRQYWVDFRQSETGSGGSKKKGSLTQVERRRQLDASIWFEEVTAYDRNLVTDKLVAIDFFPDGSASPTLLTLINKQGKRLTVDLKKASGMAEVSNGTIAEKREHDKARKDQAL